jgi:hypothetical protein
VRSRSAARLRNVAGLLGVLEHCKLPLDVTLLLSHSHLSADEEYDLHRQEKSGASEELVAHAFSTARSASFSMLRRWISLWVMIVPDEDRLSGVLDGRV